ncbi:bifunctional 4-hydroxy-2-oxoglutarate aldolase/2-dehydro-3-deoxy-phosphogluconate aldolase [Segetibacter sp.]|jgi:2-dehydro-3-deoxyphosphogluconate aldolase/(4S)-4-hydroxy-2-oxoglutarate aldolase|uniref:bifunctional 4-hydroxy-2-oxoglutarate aldolase/2-dehydro-3-deoxy-phosphogluconate aldolase n=1 Tax=Segetibacter sp. TaxID=2231182 RepID=UPI002632E09C|nr:bifunctional 4-hydroxy-2-oxoglutarate aldolase/2-dehydro-3-deoxy-phosphogluconate aldolase [Segetibacter sp.]MCW3081737.1 2-dehydro-3-deoxyphosphogluconate aldolase/4-hydroxy-2-oxoglutarate aldolase [Segetibacter sp.]
MIDQAFSWELFNKVPVIGIVRNVHMEDMIEILPAYQQAGLTTIEITMNTPGAEEIIKYARQKFGGMLNVGAGTVCTKGDLEKALEAGAQFIVTPIIQKKIIRSCVKKGIPIFPGAFTPTEIYRAWSLGASMVKIFPARTLGSDYIKDVKAPLNEVKLLPTGGIDLDNIESFKKAGADGFGVGSPLLYKNLIKNKDWVGLQEHFKKFVDKVMVGS